MNNNFDFIQEYLEKMTIIQKKLVELLEKGEDNAITSFINHIREDKTFEFNSIIHLISVISNYYHRTSSFLSKIYKILSELKKDIINHFSNYEIFVIFRKNKLILLYLLEEKILIPDQTISNIISSEKYYIKKYPHYFLPEFKSFFTTEFIQRVSEESNDAFQKDPQLFYQKRKNGQNDGYLYQLIRDDSISEFVKHITFNHISFTTATVKPSIFETNSFLLKNEATLIEYSAFFGSSKIFNFLVNKKTKIKESLWMYSIYGNNPYIIHFLEENHIISDESDFYQKVYIKAVKCHHNDIMNYIKNLYYEEQKNKDNLNDIISVIKYYNFEAFPSNILDYISTEFLIASQNLPLFQLWLEKQKIDLNEKINGNISFLQYAALVNNIELCLLLLKQPETDVNFKSVCCQEEIFDNKILIRKCEDEKTALNEAIEKNNFEIVYFLLLHPDIKVNLMTNHRVIHFNSKSMSTITDELTPLEVAISKENADVVKLLLTNKDIDINQITTYSRYNNTKKIEETNEQKTAISYAISYDSFEIQKLLLEREELNVIMKLRSSTCDTNEYIDGKRVDPFDKNNQYFIKKEIKKKIKDKSYLLLAILDNKIEVVKLLLSKGIDVNTELISIQDDIAILDTMTNGSNSIDYSQNSIDEYNDDLDGLNKNIEVFKINAKSKFTKKKSQKKYNHKYFNIDKSERKGNKKPKNQYFFEEIQLHENYSECDQEEEEAVEKIVFQEIDKIESQFSEVMFDQRIQIKCFFLMKFIIQFFF